MFWGLAVWIWILIGTGVFCLGGCGITVLCFRTLIKKMFFPNLPNTKVTAAHTVNSGLELANASGDGYSLTPSTPKTKQAYPDTSARKLELADVNGDDYALTASTPKTKVKDSKPKKF
jgi:hypothetical protein